MSATTPPNCTLRGCRWAPCSRTWLVPGAGPPQWCGPGPGPSDGCLPCGTHFRMPCRRPGVASPRASTPDVATTGRAATPPPHWASSPKPWYRRRLRGPCRESPETRPPGQVGTWQALHKGQCELTGSDIPGMWPGLRVAPEHSLNFGSPGGNDTCGVPLSGSGKRPCHIPRLGPRPADTCQRTPHPVLEVYLKPRGGRHGPTCQATKQAPSSPPARDASQVTHEGKQRPARAAG